MRMPSPLGSSVVILAFSMMVAPSASAAQRLASRVDPAAYRLIQEDDLVALEDEAGRRLILRQEWLLEGRAEEEGEYLEALDFDSEVTAFDLGDGRQGLHLSSYEISAEGAVRVTVSGV